MTDSSVLFLKDGKGCGIFQTCGVGLGGRVNFFQCYGKVLFIQVLMISSR